MKREAKIEIVRNNIIKNVQVYKNVLAGRYYLYIFENQCFEMYFGTDNFLHLTGVKTNVSPNQFYQLAKKGKLESKQLMFDSRHPLPTAMKKSRNLYDLDKFISEGYFIVKDLVTPTATYPYAITNIDRSILIGLKEEETEVEIYIPKSFRVKGDIINKSDSSNIFEIQAILCKTDKLGLYDNILYQEKNILHSLDEQIKSKIHRDLLL